MKPQYRASSKNSVYWPASRHWRYPSVDSNVKVRIWRHAEIHPTPARFTFVFVCLTTFCLVSQLQRFIVMLMVLVWGITEKKRKKVYWHIHKENPCATFWSFQVFSLLGYACRRSGQDEHHPERQRELAKIESARCTKSQRHQRCASRNSSALFA